MLVEDQSRLQKIDELYDLRLDQYISPYPPFPLTFCHEAKGPKVKGPKEAL
jgi:hypothetical protein